LVIEEVVDDGEFLELHDRWARNVVCGLSRLDGHVVGVVASQPSVLTGALDIDASQKAARFVRTCDAFNVPSTDPGRCPRLPARGGPGAQRHHPPRCETAARLLRGYRATHRPVLRKACGGAYIVMDSRSIGADLSFAFPSNEIAVLGAEAAIDIIGHREIAAAEDPAAKRQELIDDYTARMLNLTPPRN
jgi:acetyl-CoA carboxylase carboxyltransferase component